MANEYVNKVVLGSSTLIDLTADTVTAADVAAGRTLHLASGASATGTASYAAAPENNGNAVKANGILYAAVDSTSTSTKFTATVEGLTELYDGACVMLHNGVVTSAKGFTVNVNGLGAKKCYSNMTNATQETTIFNANYTLMFVYSTALDSGSGGWWVYRGYDANTTYTPAKLGFGHGQCTTAAATAAKVVTISNYVLNTGGIVSVLFDHDVQAGATLNITSKGAKPIYHKGAAIADGVIKAGDTATFMYSGQYHLVSIDRDDIADGSVTTAKLAKYAVTADKLADNSVYGGSIANDVIEERHLSTTLVDKLAFATDVDREVKKISLIAADAATSQALAALGFNTLVMTPKDMGGAYTWPYLRLCWISSTTMEVAPIRFYGNLQTGAITLYAKGSSSMASGVLDVDESWTITALPTDVDGVSY